MGRFCHKCNTSRCIRVKRIGTSMLVNFHNNVSGVVPRIYDKSERRPDGSRILMNNGQVYEVGKKMTMKRIYQYLRSGENILEINPIYKDKVCILHEQIEDVTARIVEQGRKPLNGCCIKLKNGEIIETETYSVTYVTKWWKEYE